MPLSTVLNGFVNLSTLDGTVGVLSFNLRVGELSRSTFRRKVNRQQHAEVPDQLMRWVWAGGRKLEGLIKRREAEAGLYSAPDC